MGRQRGVAIVAVVVAVVVLGVVVAAIRSVPSGCAYPSPAVDLPAVLRAQGEFSQPFDAGDTLTLQQAAVTAATSLHSDLIGVTAATPVGVHSTSTAKPDAVVVPLLGRTADGTRRVVGLVEFLTDCSGRLHYAMVRDDIHTPADTFPPISADSARTALGPGATLVYTDDPLRPLWRSASGTQTTAAT